MYTTDGDAISEFVLLGEREQVFVTLYGGRTNDHFKPGPQEAKNAVLSGQIAEPLKLIYTTHDWSSLNYRYARFIHELII